MASLTTVAAILKEVYPGAVEDQLNQEVALYQILKDRKQVQAQGKQIKAAFHTRRGAGIGSRRENETLPTAGAQGYASPTVNYGRTYKRGQISGPAVRDTYTDDAAFENALYAEIKYDIMDLVDDLARQWHTGDGVLTTVNGAVTASTSVVVVDLSYLYVGQYLEFWNGATNQTTADSGQTGTKITAINRVTSTLTVTTAQTITSGAKVALAGNNTWQTAGGGTKEMQGLDTIVDDGTDYSGATYFGVDRSSSGEAILQGNRIDFSNTTTEDLMQQAIDAARLQGGGKVDAILTDYKGRRKYAALLLGLKRYPVNGMNSPSFAGGFKQSDDMVGNTGEGLTFDDVTLLPSRKARANKMFFLDMDSFTIFLQSDIEWILNGDSILHPLMGSQNIDAYQYGLFYEAQMFCNAPNRNTKAINLY